MLFCQGKFDRCLLACKHASVATVVNDDALGGRAMAIASTSLPKFEQERFLAPKDIQRFDQRDVLL
jgi:hypothetical protein